MLDPDFIYETQQNKFKVHGAKELIDDFEKLPMPSLMQYMKVISQLKDILTQGD